MRTTTLRTAIAVSLASAFAGCSAGERTVRLSLQSPAGEPVAGAHVTAAPIGISASPLPVSGKNIEEARSQKGSGGVTDTEGALRLVLGASYTYEIRVAPPPLSPDAARGVAWSWTIGPDGKTLTEIPSSRTDPRRPTLTVDRR